MNSVDEDLLRGLDANQRTAVQSVGAPLCIIAGAGSGKTTVLTRRIARRVADGSADAHHVLALTFTRQASGELVRRLAAHGLRDKPTVGTFHGVAYSVLRQRWEDQGKRAPTLLTQRSSLVGGLSGLHGNGQIIAEVTAEIDWSRARRVTPDRYPAAAAKANRQTNWTPDRVASAFAAYEAEKAKRGLIDFDDLLEQCLRLIERDRTFAQVQQWRFRHLFVDEFQDINPLQMKLLEVWRGGRPDLCIVGDPNQAIYGWNGSDPSFLQNAERLYPGLTVVRLQANYRSTPEIVAAGQAILGSEATTVTTTRAEGARPQVHAFSSDVVEADGIAMLLIERHQPGQRWSSCAVLTRTNSQLIIIEQRLTAAGIPVRSRATNGQLSHPAIRSALADAVDFSGRHAIRDWIAEVQFTLQDPDAVLTQTDRDALELLVKATYEHVQSEPFASVTSLRMALAGDHPKGDGVELLSFHAAKGREWHTVVVAGVERGFVPHASASTPQQVAEETRLLYVALTRATQTVHVTWARSRTGYRAARKRAALLDDLPADEPVGLPCLPAVPVIRRRATKDPTLDELRLWRLQRAAVAGMPAEFVMSDALLAEIARLRPSSVDGLSAIPGISAIAAARFGPQIVAIVRDVATH